jgi:hypothetical protein
VLFWSADRRQPDRTGAAERRTMHWKKARRRTMERTMKKVEWRKKRDWKTTMVQKI